MQDFTHRLTGFRPGTNRGQLDPRVPPQLTCGGAPHRLRREGGAFYVQMCASTTTVTLRGGNALPVETSGGTQTVGAGSSLSIPTRRPDLTPTTNVARCKPATATSEESGMFAEAAVDGSKATIWAPARAPAPSATDGSLTVDLGARTKISGIVVQWTDTLPASSAVQTSLDGSTWTNGPPADSPGQFRNPV